MEEPVLRNRPGRLRRSGASNAVLRPAVPCSETV